MVGRDEFSQLPLHHLYVYSKPLRELAIWTSRLSQIVEIFTTYAENYTLQANVVSFVI